MELPSIATALLLDVASLMPNFDSAFILQSFRISLILAFVGVFLIALLYFTIVVMSSDQTIFNLLKLSTTKRSGPPVAPFGLFECIHNMTSEQQPWFPLRARNTLGVDTFVLPLPRRPIMTGDYELAREVLSDPLSIKPKTYLEFEPRGIGNIFTRNGPYWHVRRKGSAPAFSNRHVRRMNQVALEITEKWIQEVLIPCTEKGESFDVSKEMISITLGAFCKTAFEYDINEQEKEDLVYNLELQHKEFLSKSINNPLRKYLGNWLPARRKALEAAQAVETFGKKIINQYRANPNPAKGTIIDCLVKNPCYKNDDEIVADVVMFLTAGHDTTAYTIAFTLLELARNKDEQTKVREDIRRVANEDSGGDKCITDKWKKSDILHMAIKESMRLYPVSAGGSSRVCGRDFVTKEGWIIPKGTSLVSHIMMIHRNKKVFGENADEYVPSRWEKPTQAQKHSFLPFSAGKQNCVGQSLAKAELHCIVPRILSEVELEIEEEGILTWFLTLKPMGARCRPKRVQRRITKQDESCYY